MNINSISQNKNRVKYIFKKSNIFDFLKIMGNAIPKLLIAKKYVYEKLYSSAMPRYKMKFTLTPTINMLK